MLADVVKFWFHNVSRLPLGQCIFDPMASPEQRELVSRVSRSDAGPVSRGVATDARNPADCPEVRVSKDPAS
jgi:hypothetical protein